jgi:hypothetical protein
MSLLLRILPLLLESLMLLELLASQDMPAVACDLQLQTSLIFVLFLLLLPTLLLPAVGIPEVLLLFSSLLLIVFGLLLVLLLTTLFCWRSF